jgi:hypothetical protein
MSKLEEYILVLSDDGAEHARYRRDRPGAMARFGLSESEQEVVLTGSPAAIRTELFGRAERPEPVPVVTKPKPPKPPKP